MTQRGRAMLRVIEYFAKSLKVIRNDTLPYSNSSFYLGYSALNNSIWVLGRSRSLKIAPFNRPSMIFSQPSIYIDGWLYGMRMTSVVCNVPVLSQNDSTYHHSVFTT